MRRSGLVRPDESTRSGPGVCAAVAGRLGIDATLVRVGVIVLTVFGGFGLLAYGLAWLLFPQADGRIHAEEMLQGRFTSGAVGSLVAIFFGFGGLGRWWGNENGGGWGTLVALVSIAGVIALVVWGVQQSRQGGGGAVSRAPGETQLAAPVGAPATAAPPTSSVYLGKGGPPVGLTKPVAPQATAAPPPPPQWPVTLPPARRRPAGPAVTALVAGVALVAAATVLLVDRISSLGGDTGLLATGAAVVVIGLSVLLVGLAGRRAGGLTGLAIVALVLLGVGWADARAGGVLSDWDSGERSSSFDDAQWTPTTVDDGEEYSVRFGSGTLDLTRLDTDVDGDPPTVVADVRLGSMVVEVSDEQTVELDLSVNEGSLEAPGFTDNGDQDIRTTIGPDGPVDLRIEGSVRLGELVVQEENR
jgi:phage shock protein PspC (stress-responsive transcriptional regulator)